MVRRRDTKRWLHFRNGRRRSWSTKENPHCKSCQCQNCYRWAPLLILPSPGAFLQINTVDCYAHRIWLLWTQDQVCNDEQRASELQLSRLTTTIIAFALNAALLLAWIWRTCSATMTWNLGAILLDEELWRPAFFRAQWGFWRWILQNAGILPRNIDLPQVTGPACVLDKKRVQLAIKQFTCIHRR